MDSSALTIQDEKFKELGLNKLVVNQEQVCCYERGLGAAKEGNPVLVLVHGYPEAAYMWRHFIPLLPSAAPLFVPDLPGYGGSAPIEKNDKLSVGNAFMSALKTVVKRTSSSSSLIPVVFIAHDRGARVAHRLAVSGVEGIQILGVCLIDIVPTLVQWTRGATHPAELVTYFHWPFLAASSIAIPLMKAYGASKFCQEIMLKWAGTSNPSGLKSLQSDDALDVYGEFFAREDTLKASCADYEAGAKEDVDAQREDQEAGRKIKGMAVALVFSEGYIGKRFDIPKEWREWVEDGVEIKSFPVDGGVGHFVVEEAPEESARVVLEWLGGLGVKF